jgi:hypothetical protein
MSGWLAPLEIEPVSVHAPFVCYPGGQYRYADVEERRAALLAPLRGVRLGAYDQRTLDWLAGWEVSTVAVVVSLLWRARHAAVPQSGPEGGESCGGTVALSVRSTRTDPLVRPEAT